MAKSKFVTFNGGYYKLGYYSGESVLLAQHPSATPADSSIGQVFTTPNRTLELTDVIFYIRKLGSPKGELKARLYATTASGACYVPTGSVLAESDAVNMDNLDIFRKLVTFHFSTTYTIAANTRYAIVVAVTTGTTIDASNAIYVGYGPATTLFTGNYFYYDNGGWTCSDTYDMIFFVGIKSDWKYPTTSPATGSTTSTAVQVIAPSTLLHIDPATGHTTGIKNHIKLKAIWFELGSDSAGGVGWSWGDAHGGYGPKMFIRSTSGISAINLIGADINCQSGFQKGLYLRNPNGVTVTYTIIFEYV